MNPNPFKNEFKEADYFIDVMKRKVQTASQLLGYMEQSLEADRSTWSVLGVEPGFMQTPLGVTGIGAISSVSKALGVAANAMKIPDLVPLATSVNSLSMNTTLTRVTVKLTGTVSFQPRSAPPFPMNKSQNLSERFREFDPALANVCAQVFQILYGTDADAIRSAMYTMRQAYDQFIANLAPDDQVRASEFFSTKKDGKPDQVTRAERIRYAAEKRVKNVEKRKLILANSDHTLATYKELNKAHARSPIDESVAKEAILAMNSVLLQWADGLELGPVFDDSNDFL